jgi:hypothetical protein
MEPGKRHFPKIKRKNLPLIKGLLQMEQNRSVDDKDESGERVWIKLRGIVSVSMIYLCRVVGRAVEATWVLCDIAGNKRDRCFEY